MSRPGPSFIVEGAIGVGKTSTLCALRELRPDWTVRDEPVKEWESLEVGSATPVNLLKVFYDLKDGQSFRQLQSAALYSLCRRYTADTTWDKVHVYERSIRVAREVFLKNSSHLLTPVDRTLLEETSTTFQQLLEDEIPAVYLTCEESVMLDRLKERGRASEGNMTDEYACRIKSLMDAFARDHELDFIDTSHISPKEAAIKLTEWHNLIY